MKKEIRKKNRELGFAHRIYRNEPKCSKKLVVNDFLICNAKFEKLRDIKCRMLDLICERADKMGAVLVFDGYARFKDITIHFYSDKIYKMSNFKIRDDKFVYCKLEILNVSDKTRENYIKTVNNIMEQQSQHFYYNFSETSEELQLFPF